jgi:hypothetical protein
MLFDRDASSLHVRVFSSAIAGDRSSLSQLSLSFSLHHVQLACMQARQCLCVLIVHRRSAPRAGLTCTCDSLLQVLDGVDAFVGPDRVRAVLCVAGGWAGGNAASDGILRSFARSLAP